MGKKIWLTFEEAKAWAQSQGLKRYVEWLELSRSGLLPSGLPASPREAYKSEFKGWKDFLGAPLKKQNKGELLSYEDAKKWASQSGILSSAHWRQRAKAGDIPQNISRNPERTYNGFFEGWGVFLGTGNTKTSPITATLKEVRQLVEELSLKSTSDWYAAHKNGLIPKGMPANITTHPDYVSSSDIFGRHTATYEEAKAWALASPFNKQSEWETASKNGLIPNRIRRSPKTYPQFEGWGTFLGSGRKRVMKTKQSRDNSDAELVKAAS